MRRIRIAALVIALSSILGAGAVADLLTTDVGPGMDGNGGPKPTGKILLVDGASFVLQVDAASKICLAGGC